MRLIYGWTSGIRISGYRVFALQSAFAIHDSVYIVGFNIEALLVFRCLVILVSLFSPYPKCMLLVDLFSYQWPFVELFFLCSAVEHELTHPSDDSDSFYQMECLAKFAEFICRFHGCTEYFFHSSCFTFNFRFRRRNDVRRPMF